MEQMGVGFASRSILIDLIANLFFKKINIADATT
jgi:hypothetical protein